MVKHNKQVSYYDTKNKDEYISDEKNLKKIRSKNLRNFCEFYKFLEEAPMIFGLFNNDNEKESQKKFLYPSTKKGAETFFASLKRKEKPDVAKLEQEFLKEHGVGVRWISKRSLYDYMAAVKFIKACNGRMDRMMLGLLQPKK